jgi:hypothetical protein
MKLRPSLLACAALLAGCAGGPREPPIPPGPPALFLSPGGEPFRRGPQTPDPVEAWFAGADADHDGRLAAAEFMADAMRFFAVLDRNGDGRIDAFENQYYEREVTPELGADPFADRPRSSADAQGAEDDIIRLPDRVAPAGRRRDRGPVGGGGGAASLTGDPQPIRAADADVSQAVSRAEFEALTHRHFTALDTDGDGAVARAELPRARPLSGLRGVMGRSRR